jgi:hypothetical protein
MKVLGYRAASILRGGVDFRGKRFLLVDQRENSRERGVYLTPPCLSSLF